MNEYIVNVLSVFSSLKNCVDVKLIFSYFIVTFGFLFNVKQWEILVGVLILIVFDFITGFTAAKISGEIIESKKVIRSAFKVFVYSILISASHLTDKSLGITNWILTLEYATYAFLSSTELISIIENIGKMGYCVPQNLLNRLRQYTKIENDCKNCK
jgi:toxin secretion/phage lysis holin